METNYDLKEIKVLGYTTDFNVCECCGKENLRGTITIEDLTHGSILHFGTTCAVKADKYDTLDALNKAKKEINSIKNEVKHHSQFAWQMRRKFNIDESKVDLLTDDYLKFVNNPENKFKRYNWESWK